MASSCDCSEYYCGETVFNDFCDEPSEDQLLELEAEYVMPGHNAFESLHEKVHKSRDTLRQAMSFMKRIPFWMFSVECKSGIFIFYMILQKLGVSLRDQMKRLLKHQSSIYLAIRPPCHYTHQCDLECLLQMKEHANDLSKVIHHYLAFFMHKTSYRYDHTMSPVFHDELTEIIGYVNRECFIFLNEFVKGQRCGNRDPNHHHHFDPALPTAPKIRHENDARLHKHLCDCCVCNETAPRRTCSCKRCYPEAQAEPKYFITD